VRRAIAAAALAAAVLVPAGAAESQQRPRFDTQVLALVPSPGFPAQAYVHPDGRIYEGTYVNMGGDSLPSKVFEYTGDGDRRRVWTVPGQNLAEPHGVQVTTSDSRGRLVVLDRTPARVLLLDRRTGSFTGYSTFADLKPCPSGQTQPNCSPSQEDRPPIPNFGAWGPDGSLYVTDYGQAVVWRVPPGGGAAAVWLSDPRLDGGEFGTTGIALAGDRRTLLVAQGSSAGLGALNPTTGKIYSVPIGADGRPAGMNQLWESRPGDLPDGFGIARSGRLYVPMVGLPQQIAVVSPQGQEIERFPEAPGGENGSAVPFDGPSSARFLGTRLIVANQSPVAGDPARQAILDVEAGEPGLTELIPGLDRTPPAISRVSLTRRTLGVRRSRAARRRAARRRGATRRRARRPGTRLRLRLSEASTVTVRVALRRRTVFRRAGFFTRRLRAGRRSIAFRGRLDQGRGLRALPPGRYRFALRARDAAGNASPWVFRRFRVVR